tara:strand:+ start:15 stop:272 length:258 start_codon:yes stop_codon:yes gene_type:complete
MLIELSKITFILGAINLRSFQLIYGLANKITKNNNVKNLKIINKNFNVGFSFFILLRYIKHKKILRKNNEKEISLNPCQNNSILN